MSSSRAVCLSVHFLCIRFRTIYSDMDHVVSSMPKAELHAHLNGSLSQSTLQKLINLKKTHSCEDSHSLQTMFTNLCEDHNKTLDDCFKVFKIIHQLTDTAEAIHLATVDVIKEFAEENVCYLELRTTPRFIDGSLQTYVDAVLQGIDDCREEGVPILVKLLLSIDRSQGVDVARRTVDLTIKLGKLRGDVVVGLDVSGNMTQSNIIDYFPLLEEIRQTGLRLAVHTAEIRNDAETEAILKLAPHRIGHGTFISPLLTESTRLLELLKESNIPVELCLTSNKVCKTVPCYEDHHLKVFMDHNIPFSICTDDKGVFGTTLSQEYLIAARTFNLTVKQIWDFSCKSLDYAFVSSDEKEYLREKWKEWEQKVHF